MNYLYYWIFFTFLLDSSLEKPLFIRFLSQNKTNSSKKDIIIKNNINFQLSRKENDDSLRGTDAQSDLILEEKKESSESNGAYALLAFFFIFIIMGIYMICEMKKDPQLKDKTDDVWRFMFFANNGALISCVIEILAEPGSIMNYSPLMVSCVITAIGIVYYLIKFIRNCSLEFADKYFDIDYLIEIFKLPCFICSIIGLTGPCCRSDTYTVTLYADGHVEDNYCCVQICNCIMYIIKGFTVILTLFAFYIFAVVFSPFWLLGRCIYSWRRQKQAGTVNENDANKPTEGRENNKSDKEPSYAIDKNGQNIIIHNSPYDINVENSNENLRDGNANLHKENGQGKNNNFGEKINANETENNDIYQQKLEGEKINNEKGISMNLNKKNVKEIINQKQNQTNDNFIA